MKKIMHMTGMLLIALMCLSAIQAATVETEIEGESLSNETRDTLKKLETELRATNLSVTIDIEGEVEVEEGLESVNFEKEITGDDLNGALNDMVEEIIDRITTDLEGTASGTEISIEIESETEEREKEEVEKEEVEKEEVEKREEGSKQETEFKSGNYSVELNVLGDVSTGEVTEKAKEFVKILNDMNASVSFEVEARSRNGNVSMEEEIRGEPTSKQSNLWDDLKTSIKESLSQKSELSLEITAKGSEGRPGEIPKAQMKNPNVLSNAEVSILSDNRGAQIRMLQLLKRVEKQSDTGIFIIEYLNGNNLSSKVNTTSLEETISDMEALQINLENASYNGTNRELAQEFVAYKEEARKLTREFRNILITELDSQERTALRDAATEYADNWEVEAGSDVEELRQQIREESRAYNAQRLRDHLEQLGIEEREELITAYSSGELSIGEIKSRLSEELREMRMEQREAAMERMQERQEERRERIQDQRERIQKRAEERRERLQEKLEEKRELHQERIENRLEERREKLEEHRERLQEQAEERREQIQQTRERAIEEQEEIRERAREAREAAAESREKRNEE